MKSKWRVLARHKWVDGAVITEARSGEKLRFTATIRGFQGWRIPVPSDLDNDSRVRLVIREVRSIIERIDSGDDSVFNDSRYSIK